jgi:hypothetical protein
MFQNERNFIKKERIVERREKGKGKRGEEATYS